MIITSNWDKEKKPKLFIAALEIIFADKQWQQERININGQKISHLRFDENIVLILHNLEDTNTFIKNLINAPEKAALGF